MSIKNWKAWLSLIMLCLLGISLIAQDLPDARRRRKSETKPLEKPLEQQPPTNQVILRADSLPINVDSLFQALEQQINQQVANTDEGRKALEDARNALSTARRRVQVQRYEVELKGGKKVSSVEVRTSLSKALGDAAREMRQKADQSTSEEAQQLYRTAAEIFQRSSDTYIAASELIDGAAVQLDIDRGGIRIRINKSKDYEQQNQTDNDDSEQQVRNKEEQDSLRAFKPVTTGLLGFNLGLNTWTHKGSFNLTGQLNDLELKQPNSVEYTLLLFPTRIRLSKRSKWHLLTSANLLFQNYKFQEHLTLEPRTPDFVYRIDPDRPLDRNKLSMTYLQLPLQLMYASNRRKPREGFRLAAGPYVSYLLSAHTKQRELGKARVQVRDDFNLDRFQYGLGGRIGYEWFELYFNYGLSEMFERVPNAPSLRNFSIGLRII